MTAVSLGSRIAPHAIGDLTVVLADAQPVVRNGLRAVLACSGGVHVVAEADNRRDAVREALLHRPDVLILDVEMCGPKSTAAITEILQSAPRVAVLVFTTLDDDESVMAAVRAGARGYLLKSAGAEGIVRAIRGLAAGEAVFGPIVARRLTDLLSSRSAREDELFPELTAREREVLELLATGLRNSAIASQLRLSPKTVSNHISTIFGKLRADGRAEAIVLARKAGMGLG